MSPICEARAVRKAKGGSKAKGKGKGKKVDGGDAGKMRLPGTPVPASPAAPAAPAGPEAHGGPPAGPVKAPPRRRSVPAPGL
jgi:hypothetical protein